ncbi:MAG: alanine--tRNA ligase [Phycisphaerae bacterium]
MTGEAMTSTQIRQQFLDFFKSKGHVIVPSSPVVPVDDPTLLFTNAGMNQFKDVFLATGSRPYKRAANTQKCIRAGGKHNDLDDVGQDTYHHTFFEMLGNWSFGDYFKQDAIRWAWELLTDVWHIDKSRLHATYFAGDTAEGLEPDTEAAELWKTVTDIDPSHVHPGNKKDNFWEMGDTGPCGPCSEIHIDLTPDKRGAKLVNAGDARVIELWNLVFIQFNRAAGGALTALPARHVDTGMGFERLCAVLQGMERDKLGDFTNYDTDVFTPLFDAIKERTGAPAYAGTLPSPNRDRKGAGTRSPDQIMIDVAYRAIADHVRCLTFALTDGALPSNEGRGYVLRRILRRAVRLGKQYLNVNEPFLCDLVPTVVGHMGDAFPELRTGRDRRPGRENATQVVETIRDEEASFGKTLDRGIRLFNEAAGYAVSHHHGKISGKGAFKLHDTYGFPIDLTEQMAEERGLTVDMGEYERLMESARQRARCVDGLERRTALLDPDVHVEEDAIVTDATDDSLKYDTDTCVGTVRAFVLFDANNYPYATRNTRLKQGDEGGLILNRTCFYAEQGGQVGDAGLITTDRATLEVRETTRWGDAVIHWGTISRGSFALGDAVTALVNPIRSMTTKNHTSTHILNWALRAVLGDHVQQKGSLVDPEKTRFDFSHRKPMTDDEIEHVEALCREQIDADYPVYTKEVDQAKARRINTLRAVFGEKYPDRVRVVSIGAEIGDEENPAPDTLLGSPDDPKWMKYSVEFCGGTHVKSTGDAERFVLISEEAVAKGVRRVVGISGDAAGRATAHGAALLRSVRSRLEAPGDDLATWLAAFQKEEAEAVIPIVTRHRIRDAVATLQQIAKQEAKQAAARRGDAAMQTVAKLFASSQDVAGVRVVVGEVPAADADALRGAIDWVRHKSDASAVLLLTVADNRVTLVSGMSKAVVGRGVKAGDLIREVAPLVGGRGGGRPDMAQGGGSDPSGVGNAIDRARAWLAERL